MKVLLFTLEYPPFKGGVAEYYGAIAGFWPQPDNIFVLDNRGGRLLKPSWPAFKWLPAVYRLWRESRRAHIDHILAGQLLPLGTAAWLVKRLTGLKYSIIVHGMEHTYALKQPRKKWLARKIYAQAENIICGNSFTAGLVNDFLGEGHNKRLFVVNPGIDPNRSVKNHDLTESIIKRYRLQEKTAIFSLGRLVQRKGFDSVIEAMPAIVESAPKAVYVIAGAGPDEKYLKKCADKLPAGIKDKVIFTGKISEEEKWSWLEIARLFVMPSRDAGGDFEGFGIVYLEAALAGKPVIAGRSGGVEDAVIDYETGILVDPESPDDIAGGIVELLNNPKLARELGQQGWRRAIEEFNWEGQIKKIFYILNNP